MRIESANVTDRINRLTEDDSLLTYVTIFDEPDEETVREVDQLRPLFDRLPPVEADFLDLHFFQRLRQTQIAEIFGVSQPTVCYRLKRAVQRLKYLVSEGETIEDFEAMREHLLRFFSDPFDAEVMTVFCQTTCQTGTAARLGVTQGKVRHRLLRSLKALQEERSEPYALYGRVVGRVMGNLNVLRGNDREDCPVRVGCWVV